MRKNTQAQYNHTHIQALFHTPGLDAGTQEFLEIMIQVNGMDKIMDAYARGDHTQLDNRISATSTGIGCANACNRDDKHARQITCTPEVQASARKVVVDFIERTPA